MNRRDFFHIRSLSRMAGQVIGPVAELEALEPCEEEVPPEVALLSFTRRAMATIFQIILPYATPDALAASEQALDLVDTLEAQLTVYRDTSEVSSLNHRAADEDVPVEAGLFRLLAEAKRLHGQTEGAFDVAAGALIKAWGFFQRAARVPTVAERRDVLRRVGMKHLRLSHETQTVRFDVPGVELNLGSIGKGFALDRIAQMLRIDWNIGAALLHSGQSSVYAMGNTPGDARGWSVAIRHPWDADRRIAVVWMKDRALATSAATFQHLEYRGRKLGHLLDPRTGWPAEGVASATALAPTAAEADALATAFFVQGRGWTQKYCSEHPGIGAIILENTPSAAPACLGLGPEEIELNC